MNTPLQITHNDTAAELSAHLTEMFGQTAFHVRIHTGATTEQIAAMLIRECVTSADEINAPYTEPAADCTEAPATELFLQHDPVGAPYLLHSTGLLTDHHLSLSDECGTAAGILTRDSRITGIGIDLSTSNSLWSSDMDNLFFYPEELECIWSHPEETRARIRALLFSGKEAALKSLADLIRPEILVKETAYDQIDLRQFKVSILDAHRMAIHPVGAAAELLGESYRLYGVYSILSEQEMYCTIAVLCCTAAL